MRAPKKIIEELGNLVEKLQPLSKLTNKSIKPTQIKILQYVCEHPGSTVYEIWKKRALDKDIDIRTLRRDVRDLSEKGLILRFQKENFEHKAKPCIVTIAGIIYLILTRNILYKSIIKEIFKNHGNNALFKLFIYPIIKQDTLLQLTTFNSLLPVDLFLYDCCREVARTLESINTTKIRYVMEQIFIWQDVPRNEDQTNKLLGFLKQKFNLNWLDRAVIEKVGNDNNTIRISHRANAIFITLNHTKTKAILKMRREEEKKYEFIVQVHSPDRFIVAAPAEPIEEINAKFLSSSIQQRVPSFVFNLVSNALVGSSDFHILSQDEKFMKTLKETKMKFDNQYKMIVKEQRTTSFHD